MLITDDEHQFIRVKFEEFCEEHGTSHHLTSIAHLQANREAEVTNWIILQDLKIRLDRAKGSWTDELHHMLWTYPTIPRASIGEIPFSLA